MQRPRYIDPAPAERLKILDLFSGIGGFSLGLERTGGFETASFCEIDSFARRVLARHWPSVPIIGDIREIERVDGVSVICGGFPCQPFSSAARGRHVATDLWPEMRRVVAANRPRYVIAENVQQHPINIAAEDLRKHGYRTTIRNIGADDAGAPHGRSRWWLVGHPDDQGEFQRAVDAEVAKLPQLCAGVWGAPAYERAIRVPDGLPRRVDGPAKKALGNTVIPQIPEAIGRAILRLEKLLGA
jgi:DNA (cytosine-5)-methyltransferase 1